VCLKRKKTFEDMEDCTMTEIFVEQELNSLHDPSLDLDLTKLLDTCYIYDSNICDDINPSIFSVSFSLIGTNPLPNKDPLLGIDHFPHKGITTDVGFENDDLFEHFVFLWTI